MIRQHAGLSIRSMGMLRACGRTDTGTVFEQKVTLDLLDRTLMAARRVVLRLDKVTRDGDPEVAIITNLTKAAASGKKLAEMYRGRWTLETVFQALTTMLEGELSTLGYPRAALLGFGVALATYNILSTVQASLRGAFGTEKVVEDVSGFYIASEVRTHSLGMSVALEASVWEPFQTMTATRLAEVMLDYARHADLKKFKRHPRGPKKPVPKRTRFVDESHVSTARLLAKSRKVRP